MATLALRRRLVMILQMIVVCTILASCGRGYEVARASTPRDTSPEVSAAESEELTAGNNAFAFDLYQAVRGGQDDNFIFSPYSISVAAAMVYAGARGETEQEMANTLRFTLPQDALHPAFNALELALASRGENPGLFRSRDFELNIANAVWGREDTTFLPDYLDTLARDYDAGIYLVDFENRPGEVANIINDWVSEKTEGEIDGLFSPASFTEDTRLVLANAIYFYGRWEDPFPEEDTRDEPFYLLDDTEVSVPMMHQGSLSAECVAGGEGYQAIELPYQGEELAMLVVLPERGRFAEFEGALNVEQFNAVMDSLTYCDVILSMPRFDFTSDFNLRDTLADMGMSTAFGSQADFSGMADISNDAWLYIDSAMHRALVRVDEEGTEAAAFTGFGMLAGVAGRPDYVEIRIDHPFIFAIYDRATNTLLFVGRVLDPR
jgi:serpin B